MSEGKGVVCQTSADCVEYTMVWRMHYLVEANLGTTVGIGKELQGGRQGGRQGEGKPAG